MNDHDIPDRFKGHHLKLIFLQNLAKELRQLDEKSNGRPLFEKDNPVFKLKKILQDADLPERLNMATIPQVEKIHKDQAAVYKEIETAKGKKDAKAIEQDVERLYGKGTVGKTMRTFDDIQLGESSEINKAYNAVKTVLLEPEKFPKKNSSDSNFLLACANQLKDIENHLNPKASKRTSSPGT